MLRWFATNILRNIPNTQIHGPGLLIPTKVQQMHLIRSEYNRCDGSTRLQKSLLKSTMVDECVSSCTYKNGKVVANLGLPPPFTCPRFIKHLVFPFFVFVYMFRGIPHMFLKCGITNQLSNTLDWISVPQFNNFCSFLAWISLIWLVSGDLKHLAIPNWSWW
jgi:hypothetical protein